jgi:hypothetical protein
MKNRSFSDAVHIVAIVGAVVCIGKLSIASQADEGEPNHAMERCYPIDLRGGVVTPLPGPYLAYVVPPEDFDADGWDETVIKLTINDPSLHHSPKAARFLIAYDGQPTGMTVNIGDSPSNNGFSGDGADQSNDAELQIGGLLDSPEQEPLFDDLLVLGKDGTTEAVGTAEIAIVRNIVKQDETVSLVVSNKRVSYKNRHFPISGKIRSAWLYALDGQPDTEGPVNYDIFASFNRVIAGGRTGSGVGEVKVCLVFPLKDNQANRDW